MKAEVKRRVLLVEDDADLAELYRLQLEQAGYSVRVAQTAQSALDELDKQAVDVIVLDILLPHVNGFNVVHELRSYDDWARIPVVILSNLSRRELGVSAAGLNQLGVIGYLEKSKTKAEQLTRAVKSTLPN